MGIKIELKNKTVTLTAATGSLYMILHLSRCKFLISMQL